MSFCLKKFNIPEFSVFRDDSWDVIVVGGGPAGCAAAYGAAKEGAKTLLLESTGFLGGMGTSGLIPAWCPFSDGEKMIYKGFAEKIFRRSKEAVPFSSFYYRKSSDTMLRRLREH